MSKKDNHRLYARAVFLSGAMQESHFPPDQGAEVAFAGRSNVGKSSAINTITGVRALARTSKTPGRTQQINFFALDKSKRLVDLPGYGYAKVPEKIRQAWNVMVAGYLRDRQSLRGVVLLMDIRHPLTTLDRQLVEWCHTADLPFHVVLTKSDKLSQARAEDARREALRHLSALRNDLNVILFSALRKRGIDEVRRCLDRWL